MPRLADLFAYEPKIERPEVYASRVCLARTAVLHGTLGPWSISVRQIGVSLLQPGVGIFTISFEDTYCRGLYAFAS